MVNRCARPRGGCSPHPSGGRTVPFAGGDTNLYGYVVDDPVNLIDREGFWPSFPDVSDAAAGALNGLTGGLSNKIAGVDGSCAGPGYGFGEIASLLVPGAGVLLKGARIATKGRKAHKRPDLGGETGSVGWGADKLAATQRFARDVKLPPTSPAVVNRHLTVEEFVARFRTGSVKAELPGEFLGQTVEQALRSGNSTVRKLLTSGKYAKPK